MNWFESLQFGQRTDGLPRSLLSQPDFIEALQVQPEFRTGAEEMSETQGGVASDGPPPIQDFGDAIGGNSQLPRQSRGAHSQLAELLGQMFPGMNCSPSHGILLMVIDNLQVQGTERIFRPLETNPPLVVDADAVLPLTVTLERFETVSRQCRKVFERDRCLQTVEL
jgi:hypothetical protein